VNITEDLNLDLFVFNCGLYRMCVAMLIIITAIKMMPII
jgi:hypothetical protein